MATQSTVDRQLVSRVLELLGKRLPDNLVREEFPELSRNELRHLFNMLAEHVRSCREWAGSADVGHERLQPRETAASLYCDGASRGNPGPSGTGVLLLGPTDRQVLELSRFIDDATNNEAEYQALIRGLQAAEDLGFKNLQIFLDSELVVKQVRGEYRVKNPRLQKLFREVMSRLQRFDEYAIVQVGREHNKQADRLANEAIDRGLRGGERETYRLTQRE
jgi:ribonuclease HI